MQSLLWSTFLTTLRCSHSSDYGCRRTRLDDRLHLLTRSRQQPSELAVGVVEEAFGDGEVLGVFEANALQAGGSDLVDPGVGVGHQDGRVGGDHELGSLADQL